jgi:hypothetical protein
VIATLESMVDTQWPADFAPAVKSQLLAHFLEWKQINPRSQRFLPTIIYDDQMTHLVDELQRFIDTVVAQGGAKPDHTRENVYLRKMLHSSQ